ncbi:BnaC05g26620D [Brassica napus]|uniref:BnaC05g26620D protein n=1 Tax=Brassica napus TaxID=3708 RepID=A0A078EYW7_BRANA|nr:BnaC05g26620D [Brassica napus]
MFQVENFDDEFVQKLVYDALVWFSLHGLVVGDKTYQKVTGTKLVKSAPIFNELVDRVNLDAKFIQGCLSRTKKAEFFTSRLLDIHSNHSLVTIIHLADICLGLHRSDYMLDEDTKSLLQIEMNTISCSFPGFGRLVTELHQSSLRSHGDHLGLDSERVPKNTSNSQFADAMAKAWLEYNNLRLALPKELISKGFILFALL